MNTNKHLIISGILFTIVLFIWPVFMGVAQPKGNETEQLIWIKNNLTLYKIQFFFAFLLSPSIIYLMISQREKYPIENSITSRTGFIFLAAYLVLNSISYASQIILVPKFLEYGLMKHARIWYFGSSFSVAYFLNQIGYCFWGVGALILFIRLIKKHGFIKYLSIIYIISAVLSVLAFVGLIMDNMALNGLTLPSGLVLIPVGIMTTIWGIRENKNNAPVILKGDPNTN